MLLVSTTVRLLRGAAFCLALAAAPAAFAQLFVRDEGDQGLVLGNKLPLGETPRDTATRATVPQAAATSRAVAERRQRFASLVRDAARANGLPEALLQAMIEVESGFNAQAVSPKGALGLMQLMPDTARALRVRDARDPADNVDGGARYIKDLLARHGNDLTLALAAYNAGPGAVQRSGGIPRFAETQAYVPRVIARYHRLQSGAD